jgi:hypothetical protein
MRSFIDSALFPFEGQLIVVGEMVWKYCEGRRREKERMWNV